MCQTEKFHNSIFSSRLTDEQDDSLEPKKHNKKQMRSKNPAVYLDLPEVNRR